MSQALIPLWYSGNLELSSQPELKELMSRPGWGDRITCFEVAGLSPTVLEKIRDRGGAAIFNEFVETWAYSFHSPLYDELVDGCPGFDQ